MRIRHLVALPLGAVILIALTPETVTACHWWGHHRPVYRPVYFAPAPMYVAPPMHFAPPMYHAPARPAPYMLPGSVAPMPARTAPAQPTTSATTVKAADNRFEPPTLRVQPGTTVRWTNTGTHPHTVTDRDGKFDSGDIPPGGTYSVTFQTAGTYRYYCKHHKGMEGTIVAGSTGPAPAGGSGTSGSKY